ncbi:MAG: hypothetical protein ABW110_13290, partial [Steroidobacteraceae bacterium]
GLVALVGVGAMALLTFTHKPQSNDPGENSVQPSVSSSQGEFASASNRPFRISIGDTIEEGALGKGAGALDHAREQDTYTFTAHPGQRVYFRVLSHDPALALAEWKLIDRDEQEVFRTCLGCGQPGVQQLRAGGTYKLQVGGTQDAMGSYRLRLHEVPDPDRFSIQIGDSIGEDKPGRGAGTIESPGVEDVYSFQASSRQRVYFRIHGFSAGVAQARMRLLDADEAEVFNGCLGCSEPGLQSLTKGGSYTLTIGNRTDPGTGTYRLQLFDVPSPDAFSISIPAKIAAGIPGPRAAQIESPGAEDRYELALETGQKLEFKLIEYDRSLTYNRWRFVDETETELFNVCLGCSAPPVQTISRRGRYVLIVGSPTNASTGAYAISVEPR